MRAADWFIGHVLPSLLASAITTGAGIGWHHRRIKRNLRAEIASVHRRLNDVHGLPDRPTGDLTRSRHRMGGGV